MSRILKEIQDGTYARDWIDENRNGRPWFNQQRRLGQEHLLEKVGAELREMMPFISPVEIKPGGEAS
jgi:ketol-acid reductoisomerase